MLVKKYLVNELNKKMDEIKYNIGVLAEIVANGDNPLLIPFDINITLPGKQILQITHRATGNNMYMSAVTENEYVFINDKSPYVGVNNSDFNSVMDNFAIVISKYLMPDIRKAIISIDGLC